MNNLSFAKWFLENDIFTYSLFKSTINEVKASDFFDKNYINMINQEIHYRIKQFAQIIKNSDLEEVKRFVTEDVLNELAKKIEPEPDTDEMAKILKESAEKFIIDFENMKKLNYFDAIKKNKFYKNNPEVLFGSFHQKVSALPSREIKNPSTGGLEPFMYASTGEMDKILDKQEAENIEFPDNAKKGDIFTVTKKDSLGNPIGSENWKFTQEGVWKKFERTTKYGGTEILNLFNMGKIDRAMAKTILFLTGHDIDESDVINDFSGSFQHLGKNYAKQESPEGLTKTDREGKRVRVAHASLSAVNPETGDELGTSIADPANYDPARDTSAESTPDVGIVLKDFIEMLDSFSKRRIDVINFSIPKFMSEKEDQYKELFKQFTNSWKNDLESYLLGKKSIVEFEKWTIELLSFIRNNRPLNDNESISKNPEYDRQVQDKYIKELKIFAGQYPVSNNIDLLEILDGLNKLSYDFKRKFGLEKELKASREKKLTGI